MICVESERESARQEKAFSRKRSILTVSIWLSTSIAFAQATFQPPETPLEIRSQKVVGSITIDGMLDEPSWQNVKPIADLIQYEPRQGEAASLKTEVRILFDDKNLYVSGVCFDSAGRKGIRVPNMQRDFSFDENEENDEKSSLPGAHEAISRNAQGSRKSKRTRTKDARTFEGRNRIVGKS